MTEIPACIEFENFRIRKYRVAEGWVCEAICARKKQRIESQFGIVRKFCDAELKDKVNSKIKPAWCPKLKGE